MSKHIIKIAMLITLVMTLSACSHWRFWESDASGGYYAPDGTYVYGPEGQHGASAQPKQYLKADRSPPDVHKTKKRCVEVGGQKYCGYDCKIVGNRAKCATEPKQRCVTGPSGDIKCGYNCKSTHSGAKCGKYLYDNCVTNSLGEIKCGNNCREREDGELICGK